MAVIARLLCPIDGLLLASRTLVGQALQNLGDDTVREHFTSTFSLVAFTCTNGHVWTFTGTIDIRISPDTGL